MWSSAICLRTFLLVTLATYALAAPRNRTLDAYNVDGSGALVVYNGNPKDGSVYFNGTLDGLEVAHRRTRKNGLGECIQGIAKYGAVAVSIYKLVNSYTQADAVGCIEGLRMVASQNCEKKQYSLSYNSCNCMFQFGPNVVNAKNAAGETWFKYMKDRVNDFTFMGSTVFEYDINGDDMVGAAVMCTRSWEGITHLISRWGRGLRADNFEKQWTDKIKYFAKPDGSK
ncbi:unnamed protein product [Mortierella alpina]